MSLTYLPILAFTMALTLTMVSPIPAGVQDRLNETQGLLDQHPNTTRNTQQDRQEPLESQDDVKKPMTKDLEEEEQEQKRKCERVQYDVFEGFEFGVGPHSGTKSKVSDDMASTGNVQKRLNTRAKRSFFNDVDNFFTGVLEFLTPVGDFIASLLGFEPKTKAKAKQDARTARKENDDSVTFLGEKEDVNICITQDGSFIVTVQAHSNTQTEPETSSQD